VARLTVRIVALVISAITMCGCSTQDPLVTIKVDYTGLPVAELQCTVKAFAEKEGFTIVEGYGVPERNGEPRFMYYVDYAGEHPVGIDNISGAGQLTIFLYTRTLQMGPGEKNLEPLFRELATVIEKEARTYRAGSVTRCGPSSPPN
jgi:hypothetical protein